MRNTSQDDLGITWAQVAKAARKWYVPSPAGVHERSALRPLFNRLSPADMQPGLAVLELCFPTAVQPCLVDGVDPMSLRSLFFAPLVIRLNYIAQLSTTYLRANIDAKHCRLSHALGTLSILSVFMSTVIRRIQTDPDLPKECVPSWREIVAAFTYASLHDAFQGPFGHSLDAARDRLVGALHRERRLDKTLFAFLCGSTQNYAENFDTSPPDAVRAFYQLLNSTICSEAFARGIPQSKGQKIEVVWLLSWLSQVGVPDSAFDPVEGAADFDPVRAGEKKHRRWQINWIYELLEGMADADRWDYLWRDTLHLGLTGDHANVLEALRNIQDNMTIHWDGKISHLILSERVARTHLQTVLILRRKLYRGVYENLDKRLVDGILIRCLLLGLLAPPFLPDGQSLSDRTHLDHLANLVHITDAELLSILERSPRKPLGPLLSYLVRELMTYPALHVAWKRELKTPSEPAAEISRQIKGFGENNPVWIDRLMNAPASDRDRLKSVFETARAHFSTLPRGRGTVAGHPDTYLDRMLLLHCNSLPFRSARVLQFERVVWKLLRVNADIIDLIDKIIATVTAILLSAAEAASDKEDLARVASSEIPAVLDSCPPIFLALPWVAKISEGVVKEMAREPAESTIWVRLPDGNASEVTAAQIIGDEPEGDSYVAGAGYLFSIAQDFTEPERIRFDKALAQAVEKLLRLGCTLVVPRSNVGEDYDKWIVEYAAGADVLV